MFLAVHLSKSVGERAVALLTGVVKHYLAQACIVFAAARLNSLEFAGENSCNVTDEHLLAHATWQLWQDSLSHNWALQHTAQH